MDLFDYRLLEDEQKEWSRAVVEEFRETGFNFYPRCCRQLRRETRVQRIPISAVDLSRALGKEYDENGVWTGRWLGASAQTWPYPSNTRGVQMDFGYLENEDGWKRVLGHEFAHVAEFFYLTPRLISMTVEAYQEVYPGVQWHDISHPWTAAFQVAFFPYNATATWQGMEPVEPIPSRLREIYEAA